MMENNNEDIIQDSESMARPDFGRTIPIEVELGPEIGSEPVLYKALPAAGDFPKKSVGSCAACKTASSKLPLCKFCSCDATFVHDGFDPIYRKGIWQRHRLDNVCVKKMSIEEQNNRGKWMICDLSSMGKCHFYEPGN